MKLTHMMAALAAFILMTPAHALQPAPEGKALNDAQIIHITKTTGDGEIKLSQLALKMSKNADVKAFATSMVKDHTDANSKGAVLAAKLKLKPAANDTSMTLAKEANENYTKLAKMKGADFDTGYASMMVADHQKVTTMLQRTLIPAAQNAELQAFLNTGLTKFQGHLEHAQTLEDKVKETHSKM